MDNDSCDDISQLPSAITQTQKDFKLLNYELKRVIASDSESFVTLNSFYETKLEMLEGIPTYAKIDIPREISEDDEGNLFKMEFPLNMIVTTNQVKTTDIEIYMSMDCKDPCEANH